MELAQQLQRVEALLLGWNAAGCRRGDSEDIGVCWTKKSTRHAPLPNPTPDVRSGLYNSYLRFDPIQYALIFHRSATLLRLLGACDQRAQPRDGPLDGQGLHPSPAGR